MIIYFYFSFVFISKAILFQTEFELVNEDENVYPIFTMINNQKVIFTKSHNYFVEKSTDNSYHLSSADSFYGADPYVDHSTRNIFHFDNSITVIPMAHNQTIFIKPNDDGSVSREILHTDDYDISPQSKVCDQQIDNEKFLISYISQSNKKGVLKVIDFSKNVLLSEFTPNNINPSLFSCIFYKNVDIYYCHFANGTVYFYEQYYRPEFSTFSPEYDLGNLGSRLSGDEVLGAIKETSYLDYKAIAIVWVVPTNIYILFELYAEIQLGIKTIQYRNFKRTNIPCTDERGMNLININDKYFVVSGYDGERTVCSIMTPEFDIIGLEENICGYKEFHFTLYENAFYITSVNGYKMIYTEYEIVNCVNVDIITADRKIISIKELVDRDIEEYGNQIKITLVDSKFTNEKFDVVDENYDFINEVNFENFITINGLIRYSPFNLGNIQFNYILNVKVNDEMFFPTQFCTITVSNECYSLCDTCSNAGNSEENRCDSCIEGYYFTEDSNGNCYSSPPDGYRFNNQSNLFEKCPNECCDADGCQKQEEDPIIEIELPRDITKEELFTLYDKDIGKFYNARYSNIFDNNISTIVYNSSDIPSLQFDNITELNFSKCLNQLSSSNITYIIALVLSHSPNVNFYFSVYSLTGEKIDLSLCLNSTFSYDKPSISSLYSYDIDSSFYNDKCMNYSLYINNRWIDIPLKERRSSIDTICDNCSFLSFIESSNKIRCICSIENFGTFYGINKSSSLFVNRPIKAQNFQLIKCAKNAFKSYNIKRNFGFYFMMFIMIIHIGIVVLYSIQIEKMTQQYIQSEIGKYISQNDLTTTKGCFNYEEKSLAIKSNSQVELNTSKSNNKNSKLNIISNAPSLNIKNDSNVVIIKKQTEKPKQILVSSTQITKNDKKEEETSFMKIFLQKLKCLHPIGYCFIDKTVYKNIYPLISRMIFLVSCELLFNSLYYSDRYISHTYHKGYSFWYEVDKAIAASCSSLVVFIIIKFLIIDCKEEYLYKADIKMVKKVNIVYFIVVFILSLFIWYCVICFCSVYQHNQLHLLYSFLFSLFFSLFIFPFLISLLSAILHYFHNRTKHSTLSSIAKYIQILY